MNINTWIKYQVPYLPPRCRKPRHDEREEHVDIILREAHKRDLVLAYEDKSFDGKGKIYRYKGKLWAKVKLSHLAEEPEYKGKIKTALDWLIYWNRVGSAYFFYEHDEDKSRAAMIKKAKKDMQKYLLVDGVLYEKVAKPEYFILTFGCGNGDGTGLFVEYPARRDCGWHFPADKGAEAVAKAKQIATRRRDFDHAKTFKPYIVCY
jgi:hypothetical protein